MKVDKKNERYSKRNSRSIYYDDYNDDNWMKGIAPSTACPQNREQNNHGIGGFFGNCGILSPCVFSGIGDVASFDAVSPPPKKQSTCGIGGLLRRCAPRHRPHHPRLTPTPRPTLKKSLSTTVWLVSSGVGELLPLTPQPQENNLRGLWPPMTPHPLKKPAALVAVFLWWGRRWQRCLFWCCVPLLAFDATPQKNNQPVACWFSSAFPAALAMFIFWRRIPKKTIILRAYWPLTPHK